MRPLAGTFLETAAFPRVALIAGVDRLALEWPGLSGGAPGPSPAPSVLTESPKFPLRLPTAFPRWRGRSGGQFPEPTEEVPGEARGRRAAGRVRVWGTPWHPF